MRLHEREPEKILILKPSSLGDIILSLPTLAAIRKRFPKAFIGWLVKREWAGILEGHPCLDELLSFPFNFGSAWRMIQEIRKRRFNLTLDLQGLLRTGLLSYLSGAPVRVGFAGPPYAREFSPLFYTITVPVPNRIHRVQRYLLCAAVLGVPIGTPEFLIPEQPGEDRVTELMGALSAPIVAVHPFTRGPERRWSYERWKDCIERLIREGVSVVCIGVGSWNWPLSNGPHCLNFIGQTALKELVSLLKRVACLVTVDSGPMHLAAAMGTPVVALFGPTDPVQAGPYGTGHYLIKKEQLSDICVEEVVKGVLTILKRRKRDDY